jgi:hypothetical protein
VINAQLRELGEEPATAQQHWLWSEAKYVAPSDAGPARSLGNPRLVSVDSLFEYSTKGAQTAGPQRR